MKKTLILLCALSAAVAQAGVEPVLTTTFGENRTPETEVHTDFSDAITISGTAVSSVWTATNGNTGSTLNTSGAIGGSSDYYIPNINVGSGAGTWTTTLSYTTTDSLTLNYVQIEGIMCTSGGVAHNDTKERGVTYTVTIKNSEGAAVAMGSGSWTGSGNGGNNGAFSIDPIVLTSADGEHTVELTGNFTVEIAASKALSSSNGAFFGLKSVSLSIPEPTTASLSLLALAGLAASRRRK